MGKSVGSSPDLFLEGKCEIQSLSRKKDVGGVSGWGLTVGIDELAIITVVKRHPQSPLSVIRKLTITRTSTITSTGTRVSGLLQISL